MIANLLLFFSLPSTILLQYYLKKIVRAFISISFHICNNTYLSKKTPKSITGLFPCNKPSMADFRFFICSTNLAFVRLMRSTWSCCASPLEQKTRYYSGASHRSPSVCLQNAQNSETPATPCVTST